MPDPTPTKRTEAEARESLGGAISHFAAFHTQVNRDMCADCIDAYAEAVRVMRGDSVREKGMRARE